MEDHTRVLLVRRIAQLVVTSTGEATDVTARDIDRQHRRAGFTEIKHHFVIRQDGQLEVGRHIDRAAPGDNPHTVGICLVGIGPFSGEQQTQLAGLLRVLRATYPGAQVLDQSAPAAAPAA